MIILSKLLNKIALKRDKTSLYNSIQTRFREEWTAQLSGNTDTYILPVALKLCPAQASFLKELLDLNYTNENKGERSKEDKLHDLVSGLVWMKIDDVIRAWIFDVPTNKDELNFVLSRVDLILSRKDENG
jgi:hypothetical protein